MFLMHIHAQRLKKGAAMLGGAAAVAMTLVGVAAGGVPDARAGIVPSPSPMTAGETATTTSPELTAVPKAAPLVKAKHYGE